ncbi:hypothetical protein BFJ66_g3579 [Fusarium oxysporum f. sp. cepae]|uniref:Uncharacterized protein n=1 Tax=Fusarium oxysporum f. sp. cepae TaxID=396571 RepID=A0A3L6N9S8_FUSOX|nr:hypothetical protein BFJ65_g12777 [Fusarium oxysporum f. sp. cepae]RKK47809.1 hypothetical protein BFJ67_g7607 [Fusarium oxysporum f. sp. cepae]RKK56673.1 hypothetical protein BFJ66_g3579 [Fusarium oxysporum f. sp. cepae]RKK94049.1 hypothetical protein BFJ71_g9184 [Fusarium oxysporum]
MPCCFVFAAAVNLSLFQAPEVAGFASPLMVAVSHPAAAISGGFTSPWMTPLPLLYSSFKKQLAT